MLKNSWEKLLRHPDYQLELKGIKMLVKDHVFTPDQKITYSTSMILEYLPDLQGKSVLDIGCGTGVIGLCCLKQGARHAVFSDSSPVAIQNTNINIKNNNLESKSTVILSNLFEHISEKFDYIFANLPILDEVWESKESTEHIASKFLKDCNKHIKPKGKVFFVWASFANMNLVRSMLDKLEYHYRIIEEDKLNYTWYLVEISFE